MTELAVADFGQYAHSNQPVHHLLWMWAAAGERQKAGQWISRVVREMYGPGIDGFPGDEDNGEMSAWYIFAVMGFYPLCPGKPEYVYTTPQCSRLEVTLGNGAVLEIGNTLSNRKQESVWVTHAELMAGGRV
jgi:putative alpha-1,2-mannosidase